MSATATAGFVVAVLVVAALVAGVRGRSTDASAGHGEDDGTPGTGRASDADAPSGGRASDGDSAPAAAGSTPDGRAGEPDDEAVVVGLLEANDGRLPQSDVVSRTDWSKSKVSRVLSRMDDDGRVTKIDIGRGNVITLPGEEPAGAARPFDE